MMEKEILLLTFKNKDKTLLIGTGQDIKITDIEGLISSDYKIHTKSSALQHGSIVTGTKVNERLIRVWFSIDTYNLTDELRQKLIHFFNPNDVINLKINYWHHQVQIDCLVQDFDEEEYTSFYDLLSFRLELKCPHPFFKSLDSFGKNIAENTANFYFPLAFAEVADTKHEKKKVFSFKTFSDVVTLQNDGDVDVGMIIELTAENGTVTNPKITNSETKQFIECIVEMQKGDVLIFNTNVGHKSIKLKRGDEITNVSNKINKQSTYFRLGLGQTKISYDASLNKTNLSVRIFFNPEYLGV
ncbi:phage tail family protein [Erysipelotrichaceae bacterium OH741_COT-311]|nr:phage tail family protein [Erysipelotrichaceae bacterium OH741_COT-311]